MRMSLEVCGLDLSPGWSVLGRPLLISFVSIAVKSEEDRRVTPSQKVWSSAVAFESCSF